MASRARGCWAAWTTAGWALSWQAKALVTPATQVAWAPTAMPAAAPKRKRVESSSGLRFAHALGTPPAARRWSPGMPVGSRSRAQSSSPAKVASTARLCSVLGRQQLQRGRAAPTTKPCRPCRRSTRPPHRRRCRPCRTNCARRWNPWRWRLCQCRPRPRRRRLVVAVSLKGSLPVELSRFSLLAATLGAPARATRRFEAASQLPPAPRCEAPRSVRVLATAPKNAHAF
mmetsp:Transcript_55803/g.155587  ORF Transcript_55803/g.155587 Transcript_55803/m.155587 type:complete len:229 (-) Transcript_55803:174-860(-)